MSVFLLLFIPGVCTAASVNDSFSLAVTVDTLDMSYLGSNIDATLEPGEPDHSSNGSHSVWWKFTPTTSDTYEISTNGSDFDTVMAVYTGSSVDSLILVDENDDGPFDTTSLISFSATSGTEYYIAVDGYGGGQGNVELIINHLSPPQNDDFDQATEITTLDVEYGSSITAATLETGEPDHGGVGSTSVWWKFTATESAFYEITSETSAIGTVVAIYTGTSVDSLTLVDYDTEGNVELLTNSGTEYFIAVDSSLDEGDVSVRIVPAGPPNDHFVNAEEITSLGVVYNGINYYASLETNEPNHEGEDSHSVWWRWTAPDNSSYKMSASGSDFDTVLAVYTGTSLGDLTLIDSNHNGPDGSTSFVAFSTSAGTEYFIAVDGFGDEQGNIALELNELDRSINGTINTIIYNGTLAVSGAKVTVLELALSITANENGTFSFDDLPEGLYSLYIESPGYEPQTVTNIEIPNITSVHQLNISLPRKTVYSPYTLPYDYDRNAGIGAEDIILGLQVLSGDAQSPNKDIFTDGRKLQMADIIEATRYTAGLTPTPSLSILSLESDLWEPLTTLKVTLHNLGTINVADSIVTFNDLAVPLDEVNVQDNSISITIPSGVGGNVAVKVVTGQGDVSNTVYAFVHPPSSPSGGSETPVLALMVATDIDKIKMAWVPGNDGQTPVSQVQYDIHLSPAQDYTPGAGTLVTTVTGERQAEINGLSAGTTYYGKVIAQYNSSTSSPSNELQTKTYATAVDVDPSATIFIASDNGLGKHTTNDGVTYIYSQGGAPPIGSILISEDVSGEMTIRRVKSTSVSGNIITVITSSASLTDAIDTGSISTSFQMFDISSSSPTPQAMSAMVSSGSSDESTYNAMEWQDGLLKVEQTNFSHEDETLKVEPIGDLSVVQMAVESGGTSEFTATVTAEFKPELVTTAEWGGWVPKSLDSAKVAAKGTLSLTTLAQYNFSAKGSVEDDFTLFTRKWSSVYTVGPVPVIQRITLSMVASFSASAGARINASAQAQLAETVEVGATYDGNEWHPYITHSESDSFTANLGIAGKASAEVRLIPKVEVEFYKVVNSGLSVEPYALSEIVYEDLENHPTRLIHLTKFDASLGIVSNIEVGLSALGSSWTVLPSTCVMGTDESCIEPFDGIDLFSVPELNLSVLEKVGLTYSLQLQIQDGVLNAFDPASIEWEAYPNDGNLTVGQCNKSGETTTCQANYEIGESSLLYNVFASGYGILGEMAKQFRGLPLSACTFEGPDEFNWFFSKDCQIVGNDIYDEIYYYYTVPEEEHLVPRLEVLFYKNDLEIESAEFYYADEGRQGVPMNGQPEIVAFIGNHESNTDYFCDIKQWDNNCTYIGIDQQHCTYTVGIYEDNIGNLVTVTSSGDVILESDMALEEHPVVREAYRQCQPLVLNVLSNDILKDHPGKCHEWWDHFDENGVWQECVE